MKLNRSDIVATLAKRTGQLSNDDIKIVMTVILEAIKDRLAAGDRVELRGFGSFCTIYRKPRLGRNPRTGMRVDVPGKWVPHFKAGKEMRGEVNARFDANALAARREPRLPPPGRSGSQTFSGHSLIQDSQVQRNPALESSANDGFIGRERQVCDF